MVHRHAVERGRRISGRRVDCRTPRRRGPRTSDAATDADLLVEFAQQVLLHVLRHVAQQNLTKVGGRNNHDPIQQGIIANKRQRAGASA